MELSIFRRLIHELLMPHWRRLVLALSCMLVAAAMTALLAWLMEPIINQIFVNKNAALLLPVAGGVFGAFVTRGIMTYLHKYMMAAIGQNVVSDLQKKLHYHLLHADLALFQRQPIGELITRLTNDIGIMRSVVSDSVTDVGKNLLTLIFLIGVMVYQQPKLTLYSFIAFPLMGFVISKLSRKLRQTARKTQTEWARVTSRLTETFQGIRQVKAYGMEQAEANSMGIFIDGIRRLTMKTVKFSGLSNPLGELLSGFAISVVIFYGGGQVIAGHASPGEFFSFITAFTMAYEPMKRLANINANLQLGLASAERVFHLLDEAPTIMDAPDAKPLIVNRGEIQFQNVSFSYGEKDALHDVSLTAKSGQKIALVGPSGAGKSTILNLIPRFYDVQSGAVLIDNQDVRHVTQSSVRAHLALVSQDIVIFDDSVAANIAYGTPAASAAEIEHAARHAAAHEFIMALPDGYQTRLGEQGTSLSGGQRQRIAIARAMLRNAPILLLDEATSALDNESEQLITAALAELQQGRTTLVIAHRLSTVRDADQIIVMNGGRVIAIGNHDGLMQSCDLYQRLYGSQLL
jgi:subfamily B ATP-binding cassette protein MsbA